MEVFIRIIIGSILIMSFISCSKEDVGVQTVLKGHVSDNIRGVNISGYKIVLVKSWESFGSNFMSGIYTEEVATTHTDENGDYSITFNYKLKEGERYTLSEQYYGTPYYPEYHQYINIVAGKTNTVDINAWKPIELRLNVEVLNNINEPLMIRNEIANGDLRLFGTENIYEENITKTYTLRSRPDTDIKIVFWYYTGSNSARTLHEKVFSYHTTLDDVNALSYTIDCSTF